MNIADQAAATQLRNIENRTGKSLSQLFELIGNSGLLRHGEIRDMLKSGLGLGYGDANALAHAYFRECSAPSSADPGAAGDALDEIYSGAKAHLRPIQERLMEAIRDFGPFEIAPKKGYVSLRRKKQFAMIGPATRTRVEVGLNMKGCEATPRLLELPPGGMCQYKVQIHDPAEVDAELVAWVRKAYDSAG